VSVAVKNGAILAGPAWRPGRFAFGLFPAEVPLVSQVAGAPTCQPGDVSAPTTSARVVLVVLPKWPLRALPLTSIAMNLRLRASQGIPINNEPTRCALLSSERKALMANGPTTPAKDLVGTTAAINEFKRRMMSVPSSAIKTKLDAERAEKQTPMDGALPLGLQRRGLRYLFKQMRPVARRRSDLMIFRQRFCVTSSVRLFLTL
jgi:hypothetical protein